MALKKCLLCKEDKTVANYIGIRNPLLNGSLPICRKCVANLFAAKPQDERWNTANKLCQLADLPFIPEEFEKIYQAHGTDAFGTYCSIFRDKQYESLDWSMYNEAYLQLQEEQRVEDALPQVKAAKQEKLQRKWGPQYDDQQIEYLENLHQGIINSASVVGAINEDQILKLCKVSLIIEEKLRASMDIDKDLKSYDMLCKEAGITTQAMKEGSEFGSWGEVCAYLEKLGFKPRYYDGAVRDEVDKSMKDICYWNRYLYVNETGIAEEIQERIEQLKIADKLTGEDFDWGEYNKYAADIDETEDFSIDI